MSKLDGTETCSYCGKHADEIPNFRSWVYPDGVRHCDKHGHGGLRDYVKGELDINSETGLGRIGEILVTKVLGIGKEHDCNRESCHAEIDMYNKEYGRIDVKTSLLSYNYNRWTFNLTNIKEVKTYICIGLTSDRKFVKHVWIVPNESKIKHIQSLQIYDGYRSLFNKKHWEVDIKPYNDMWQTMKLDNCKIMVDKSKEDYIRLSKHDNVTTNIIKVFKQRIDKSQHKLNDYI